MDNTDKSNLIIGVIKKLKKSVTKRYHMHFANMNITGTQGMIVGILVHKGNMKISDLSKKMQLSNSTVSGIIDRLEKNNIVERIRSKEDRRVVMVSLKEEFKKEAKERHEAVEKHFNGVINLATPEELDKILEGFMIVEKLINKAEQILDQE